MTLTTPQLDLIGFLLQEALSNGEALEDRWQKAAPFARQRAEEGFLLLVHEWLADFVLARDGLMHVIDTEFGEPTRPATEDERRVNLFRSIRRYPELLSFLPSRPPTAATCPSCKGV